MPDAVPPEWYEDDLSPRSDAEREKRLGKDWLQKLDAEIAANPHGYGSKKPAETPEADDEDAEPEGRTTDKFLPHSRR